MFQLPGDLQAMIYDYDDTYRVIYSNVLREVELCDEAKIYKDFYDQNSALYGHEGDVYEWEELDSYASFKSLYKYAGNLSADWKNHVKTTEEMEEYVAEDMHMYGSSFLMDFMPADVSIEAIDSLLEADWKATPVLKHLILDWEYFVERVIDCMIWDGRATMHEYEGEYYYIMAE
jgi:hypothetical protein